MKMTLSKTCGSGKEQQEDGGQNYIIGVTTTYNKSSDSSLYSYTITMEGPRLSTFIASFHRHIESERRRSNNLLPHKLWFKQQFAMGVNEVTRLLKRMSTLPSNPSPFPTNLQAVLVASDTNPRWLSNHLLTLASSKCVPLISVKDNNQGSLRLGHLVNLKSAIAVGIKAKGSSVNHFLQIFLHDNIIAQEPQT